MKSERFKKSLGSEISRLNARIADFEKEIETAQSSIQLCKTERDRLSILVEPTAENQL